MLVCINEGFLIKMKYILKTCTTGSLGLVNTYVEYKEFSKGNI
jgi:hypothetical protein